MNENGNGAIEINKARWLMLVVVTHSVGFASELGGMGIGLLSPLVQHVIYGHGPHTMAGRGSFLQEVTAASDFRRFVALCSSGPVAGIGWWLPYRFGTPLVFYPPGGSKRRPHAFSGYADTRRSSHRDRGTRFAARP